MPQNVVYSQVTAGVPALAPWQQIGRNLEPAFVRVQANEALKYSPYEIFNTGYIQPYTRVYQKNSVSPLKVPQAHQNAGPFNPYPQVTNAAIISQASLGPSYAAAQAAASNGLQGGVF